MTISAERVQRMKEKSAKAAFTAYLRVLEEEGLVDGELVSALHGTTHIHKALALGNRGAGTSLLVRCRWDFSGNEKEVQQALQQALQEGQ